MRTRTLRRQINPRKLADGQAGRGGQGALFVVREARGARLFALKLPLSPGREGDIKREVRPRE